MKAETRTEAARRRTAGSGTSLYVHVPFCVVKCGYCDFNSFPADGPEMLDRFLEALAGELELVRVPPEPVSVFVGGGTPSYLDPARLQRLLAILARHVDLARCPEVSVEANPESVSREKVELLLAAGVDRLSLGVQTFHPEHLAFLDRAHDAARSRAAVAGIRQAGCRNLSLDLMFAIPGQSLAQWQEDLEAALALRPDHLSCYNLTFEPGTRLSAARRAGRVREAGEELQRRMFLWTRARLREAGFEPYEISNFAGPGGPCRHNDHYWLQGDYVGVGPGAASHRAGVRTTNERSLRTWAGRVAAGVPPIASAETLTVRQRAAEAIWLGLRRTDGVDLEALQERLQWRLPGEFAALIERQVEAGLLEVQGSSLRLTTDGLLLADGVGERFLAL